MFNQNDKTRENLKKAFRLAINKSKSLAEARRLNKIRSKILSGTMTETEALIAWIEVTHDVKKTLGDGQQHSKGTKRAA
jgi:hypothetical protein